MKSVIPSTISLQPDLTSFTTACAHAPGWKLSQCRPGLYMALLTSQWHHEEKRHRNTELSIVNSRGMPAMFGNSLKQLVLLSTSLLCGHGASSTPCLDAHGASFQESYEPLACVGAESGKAARRRKPSTARRVHSWCSGGVPPNS